LTAGDSLEIRWIEAATLLEELSSDSPPCVIDVREPAEWASGTGVIEGAELLPLTQGVTWFEQLKTRVSDRLVITCRTDQRSSMVARALTENGHPDVRVLSKGMKHWSKVGHPVVKQ